MTKKKTIKVIDLFCGIGGITHGFVNEGFEVVAGVDIEKSCKFGYEYNNSGAKFIHKDIREVTSNELNDYYGKCDVKILVGCAPCQPFSGMNTKKGDYFFDSSKANSRSPIDKFADLVKEIQPDIVSMENVPNLMNENKYPAFSHFLQILKDYGYSVSYDVIDTSKYGVPQTRRRLVLLASKHGDIHILQPTHSYPVTVREVISKLPNLKVGEIHPSDPYHRSQNMSILNKKRIKYIPKNGGTLAHSAPLELITPCHRKKSGKSYSGSVYARMFWDKPAPTLTTLCLGIGNGRFGHPEQDRGISLREAALIQTFPINYKFAEDDYSYNLADMVACIGNAVPVQLGRIIAQSIKKHLQSYSLA